MAHEDTPNSKWQGKATKNLIGTTAAQIWPFFQDFCSLNKWLPTIDTCYRVEGADNQPGLVRYCAATMPLSTDPTTTAVMWAHERLLAMDSAQRCLSYEIIDNNMGFKSYVGEFKVIETEDGCRIEWSFTADPVDGWKFEDFFGYIGSSLQAMAERMEKALRATS